MIADQRQTWHQAYHARALQFLTWLPFPATTSQVLAHYTARNTPMELLEDTMALPERTFATPDEFASALVAIHRQRPPHTWVSREMVDQAR